MEAIEPVIDPLSESITEELYLPLPFALPPTEAPTPEPEPESPSDSDIEMTTLPVKIAELKIRTPSDFNGDKHDSERFLQEIGLYLRINDQVYDTEEKKIIFFLSFLTKGTAESWKKTKANELLKKSHWGTYKDFEDEFKAAFSPVDGEGDARSKLRDLKQTGTADEFIAEFKSLAAHSGITEYNALVEYFQEGLSSKLMEKIYALEKVPTTMEGWYEYASRLDNQWHRGHAVANRSRNKTSFPSKKNTHTVPKYYSPHDPNAMDVDRLSLDEQKKHMEKGLCFFCHKPSHRAADHKGGNVPPSTEPKKFSFSKKEEHPQTGKNAYSRMRAIMAELPENERDECLKELEEQGF